VSRPMDETRGYSKGREVDLMIGTARPWRLALGQAFPIALATFFISLENVWLFYFALCSALSGAMASVAAERSRCLWLRGPWSRAELFSRVEAGFLRQGACSVSVLLLLLAAIGIYREFPIQLLALGIPLLILGTVASTYLGLMMTRGIDDFGSIMRVAARRRSRDGLPRKSRQSTRRPPTPGSRRARTIDFVAASPMRGEAVRKSSAPRPAGRTGSS